MKILLCKLRCAEIRIITKSLARVRVISGNLLSLRSRYVQIVSGRKSPAKAQISTRRPNVSAHAILRNAGGQCTFLKIERNLAALPEYFYKRKLNRVSCRRTDTAFCRREDIRRREVVKISSYGTAEGSDVPIFLMLLFGNFESVVV